MLARWLKMEALSRSPREGAITGCVAWAPLVRRGKAAGVRAPVRAIPALAGVC